MDVKINTLETLSTEIKSTHETIPHGIRRPYERLAQKHGIDLVLFLDQALDLLEVHRVAFQALHVATQDNDYFDLIHDITALQFKYKRMPLL